MPTYYVGPGGNDGNTGLSWAQRKLTLNGAEDIPVQPGDICYVGPGVYREQLTVDVSGAAGSPITYIGDYTGANTDGVGGVVRITGSDDDTTSVRLNGIASASVRDHRTFSGFAIDYVNNGINIPGSFLTIQNSYITTIFANPANGITIPGTISASCLIRNCFIRAAGNGLYLAGTSAGTHTGHTIENCVVLTGQNYYGIRIFRSTALIRNNFVAHSRYGIFIENGGVVGVSTAYNNIIQYTNLAFSADVLGNLVVNYNCLFANTSNYSNVSAGANDFNADALIDTRWFFEAVNGGRMVTPFDLGQWSQLIDLAGTNPPATDLRGTGQIGTAREWGPLEYDPTLEVAGGGVGAGAVSISPYRGNL